MKLHYKNDIKYSKRAVIIEWDLLNKEFKKEVKHNSCEFTKLEIVNWFLDRNNLNVLDLTTKEINYYEIVWDKLIRYAKGKLYLLYLKAKQTSRQWVIDCLMKTWKGKDEHNLV